MGELYDRALAERGFVVVAIDFRQAPRFQHPAGSADVTRAVRWIRGSADLLGADASRIGLVGSSSGGHLALLAACRPDESEHVQPDPGEVRDPDAEPASASVSCVAALWPPVDPLARYRFALDRLDSGPPELRRAVRGVGRRLDGLFRVRAGHAQRQHRPDRRGRGGPGAAPAVDLLPERGHQRAALRSSSTSATPGPRPAVRSK